MTRCRVAGAVVFAAMLTVGSALFACAAADGANGGLGHVYWTNESGNSIGRADLDGGNADQGFITGATAPRGVAIDGAHVYWAHDAGGASIGRAELDGTTDVNQTFIGVIGVGSSPQGVALDATRIYWTHTVSLLGKVGSAKPDGSGATQSYVSTQGSSPCGIDVDGHRLYWANAGTPGSVGSAHGVFGVNPNFITATQNPCGVAVADGYLYWTNRAGDSIGRATIDGTTSVDPNFISTGTGSSPCGVAVDGTHIYWTTASGTIERAEMDGTNPTENLITGAQSPCAIAVTPKFAVTPLSYSFDDTAVGSQSAIQALSVTNTSSSVLAVSDASFVGPNAADFEKTGDGCTPSVTPSQAGCVLNVRFTPTTDGMRSAALRITSNASSSPVDVAVAGVATPSGGGVVAPSGGVVDSAIPLLPRDATNPRLLTASVSPSVFRVDDSGPAEAVVSVVSKGTTFRYSLSEAARVVFTIEKKLPGRRVAGRCLRPTRNNRSRSRCTRYLRAGRFARGSTTGPNTKRFSGKIGRSKLVPGDYRAGLLATDAAGNASRLRYLHFRVVR